MHEQITAKKEKKPLLLRTGLMMIINPAGALKRQLQNVNWKITASIPALAFGLLFFQTALDLNQGTGITILLSLMGVVYGGVLVTLLGMGCSIVLVRREENLDNKNVIISAMHLAYTSMLIYQITGVTISIFLNWNTAVAFGVSGMLFVLRPIMVTLRQLSSNQVVSIILTTIIGFVLLAGWSLLGIIGG